MTSRRRPPHEPSSRRRLCSRGREAPGPFRGCSGGAGENAPLPHAEEGCFDDGDCMLEGCEPLRCIAGRCVWITDVRHADEDKIASCPCGKNCDDANQRSRLCASAMCDRVGPDCEGRIDEDAPPTVIFRRLPTGDPTMTVVRWGAFLLVADEAFPTRASACDKCGSTA